LCLVRNRPPLLENAVPHFGRPWSAPSLGLTNMRDRSTSFTEIPVTTQAGCALQPAAILHDESGGGILDRPGRWEAADRHKTPLIS
jgi:hypothetical protein